MKRHLLIMFTILFYIPANTNAAPSIISKCYGYILGNQPVSPEYQIQTKQALLALKVNPENVSVNQMNGLGSVFARMNLSSFTAFGIWLNEKLLNTLNNEEKTFQLYHEAAHYAQKHHQKILLGSALVSPIIVIALKKFNDYLKLKSIKTSLRYSTLTGSTLLILAGLYLYVLPKIVKEQEKEADLLAAQVLIESGNKNIVNAYLEELKLIESNESTPWWYSTKEQIDYLNAI